MFIEMPVNRSDGLAVMSLRWTPRRLSVVRARILGAVRSCWTIRPPRSIPRIRVRTDVFASTFAGGAFRLTLLPVVTGVS
jgi:hypothetical protein